MYKIFIILKMILNIHFNMDSIILQKDFMKDLIKENGFFSYFLFIYDYINKCNYVPVLVQIFVMEFVREYLLRTSRLLLFDIKDDESNQNYDFYIISFFVLMRICNNFYIKYKYNFDRKYENVITSAFNKSIFIARCKIPFHVRQKLNMNRFEELQNNVSSDINNMINNVFESFVNIMINIVLSFSTFYKHKMLTHYFLMITTLYFVIKNILYPMRKAQMKIRASNKKVYNKIGNEISLLNFNFVPFLEHMNIYEKIQKKHLEINNLRTSMKNMSKNIFSIIHYLSDFFLIALLFNNYASGLRNYYIIVTTLTSLFDVSKTLLNSMSDIEESVDRHKEFSEYFKDIPNDDDYIYASSIPFPLQMEINVPLYNEYVVSGKIEINRNDKIFITGPSGAGKSTLAKKIAGYDYYISGIPIYRNCVYYLTQDYNESWSNSNYTWKNLFSNMNSINELKDYLSHFAFPLHKFSESSTFEDEIPMLSGGEKKRLQYAFLFHRDLLTNKNNKEIIILDEPHKDLDEATALSMIDGIQKLLKDKCLIIIKHEKPYNWFQWKEFHVNNHGNISLL
jgi:ABC-type lipoprotein export system ATPase subunit